MLDNQELPSKELDPEGLIHSYVASRKLANKMNVAVTLHYEDQDYTVKPMRLGEKIEKLKEQLTTTQQALDSAVAAQQWQSIESAPKDAVILTCGDVPKFIRVSYFDSIKNKWSYYPYGSGRFEVSPPYWWRSLDSLNIPFEDFVIKKPEAALASIKE